MWEPRQAMFNCSMFICSVYRLNNEHMNEGGRRRLLAPDSDPQIAVGPMGCHGAVRGVL